VPGNNLAHIPYFKPEIANISGFFSLPLRTYSHAIHNSSELQDKVITRLSTTVGACVQM
jgi:hypothetical protein